MATTVSRGKKRITIVLAAVLTLAGAGAALAYWTSTGTGTGAATSGESTAFTISSVAPVGTLAPGSAGQTVDFTVTNPGEGTQNLTTVTVSLATADGVAWVPTGNCLASDYTATVTAQPSPGEIAPGGSVGGTVTVTLADSVADQDDCQGQSVPLYLVAS